jgi:hypothetical protein
MIFCYNDTFVSVALPLLSVSKRFNAHERILQMATETPEK